MGNFFYLVTRVKIHATSFSMLIRASDKSCGIHMNRQM